MRAAVLRRGQMVVDDIDDLTPGPGQVLVETIACGICGSDLHTVDHAHELTATATEADFPIFQFDADRDLVMGHEVTVSVLDTGAGVDGLVPGTAMAAMPSVVTPAGQRAIPGYDNTYPGGYSERMLLSPQAMLPIPNGLDPVHAALTEPLAVGLHAVNQSSVGDGRPAIVVGAGPVGLAVIAALAVSGVEPIIAADFSPARRNLAQAMGAHVVVDPSGAPDRLSSMRLNVDAWSTNAGPDPAPPVIFEAVGVPGMIDTVMTAAPGGSEVVVVGVCMETDTFRPAMGIYHQLVVRFVLGWTPAEFAQSLANLAEGRIDPVPLITGQVDLDGVPDAFATLATPDDHIKIMVRPNGLD